jgi:predicted nucleic acid-binding protein
VNLYAESSAVLAWLLDEPRSREVLALLADSDAVITSDLTLIECDRVLRRAVVLDEMTEADAADRRAHLAAASARWHVLRMASEVIDRARQSFPGEPIRTLDAIHLASALVARSAIPGAQLLSLDERVRRSGKGLGFTVLPE